MPNGSLLKQYHPVGVMNVVRRREDCVRTICQKPLLASSFVKMLAPFSRARISSTFGRGWTSCRTLSLTDYGRGCTGQLNFELRNI